MNTVQGFFLITVLLITALLTLTVLLIVVTEQPDSMIEGRHRVIQFRERSEKQLQIEFPSNDGEDKSEEAQLRTITHSSVPSPTTTTAVLTHPSSSPSQIPLDFELEKMAQFGPSEGGKFMGIQLMGNCLYLPKDDGRIEVRDSQRLVLIRTVSTGIRIHRLRAVNERIFVILDNTFGRLFLFDASSGKVLKELKLKEPAKELTLDGAKVHTLARFGTHIDSFELDELRPVTEENNGTSSSSNDTYQPNCNFISSDGFGALLVSCGRSVVKMSRKGNVLQCFTAPEGVNYSALFVSQSGRLLILNRAQRILYLVDKDSNAPIARLHHCDGAVGSASLWIWTHFGVDQQNGTLFILEYISNRVEVFKMASDVLHLL